MVRRGKFFELIGFFFSSDMYNPPLCGKAIYLKSGSAGAWMRVPLRLPEGHDGPRQDFKYIAFPQRGANLPPALVEKKNPINSKQSV